MGGRCVCLLAVAALACAGCGSNEPTPHAKRSHARPRKEVKLGTAPIPPQAVPRRRKPPRAAHPGALRPPIRSQPIPYPARRKREMAAYSRRHYGRATYRLIDPKVIVEHYTETSTAQAAFNIFVRDTPDPELHELPGVCSHFLVDRDGTISQLAPLSVMCRHTVGLNYTAIGIEH